MLRCSETFQYSIKYNPRPQGNAEPRSRSVEAERHAPKEQRYEDTDGTGETETGDTPLKNRGMRIQTVQEKLRQERRPLRTEVGNDLRNI